ncbi:YbfB/YjiJ family MFS transporter [Brucellaceae bacterium C25G]
MHNNVRLAPYAAALILMIGMGFGRFAFTGLYPLMVRDGQVTVEAGSIAASVNYAGYLFGALLAVFLSSFSSRRLCAYSTVITVVTLFLLGALLPDWLLIAVRGIAGISSAIAMVAASHWLIHDHQQNQKAPVLFAGVGVGIIISAELIAIANKAAFSSYTIWLVIALTALVLGAVTMLSQIKIDRSKKQLTIKHEADHFAGAVSFGATRLIIIYGLAGFGYIITATYLPLLVKDALGSVDPIHVWTLFGLSAVPSCYFWHMLHGKMGTGKSLFINLLVQAIGVLFPVFHTPFAYVISALLVGGTFLGTVTIAMSAARKFATKVRFNMLAIMTASYGVGQIIGPLIAAYIYSLSQSFDNSLVFASAILVSAALLCIPVWR